MNPPAQSPTQIAWVTPDLAATETALTGLLGVRKWVRIPNVHFARDSCSYRGKPADFVASISLSYLGDMQLELLSPVSRVEPTSFCRKSFCRNGSFAQLSFSAAAGGSTSS